MRQSNLLVLNTIAVYVRMALTIPMGILLVRFAYGELGEIDFGLWTAVGASTALMAVVTTSLTTSGQRHLAYAMGAGSDQEVAQVFRAVQAVFWFMGVAVLVVGAAIAPLLLGWLTIPDDRTAAAWWVLHLSLVMVGIKTCTTPYRAILNASQAISIVATAEFLGTFMSLINAWCLRYVPSNKLTTYAAIETAIVVVTSLYVVAIALYHRPASRCLPLRFSRSDMQEVGGFAFWSFLGNMAATLRNQGAILIVNVIFGPAANSAVALAVRAHGFLYRAAMSLNVSISPALTTNVGRQNEAATMRLMNLGCKLPFLAATLLFTPFVLETEYLLDLWQSRAVPPDTALHTRWLCGMALAGVATWGYSLLLEAKNRISRITIVQLASIATGMVVAWLGCRHLGWPAWSVTMTMCLFTVGNSVITRPWFASRELGVSIVQLWKTSLLPSLAAFVPAFSIAAVVHALLPAGGARTLAVLFAYLFTAVPLFWLVAFDTSERSAFADIFRRAWGKLFPSQPPQNLDP